MQIDAFMATGSIQCPQLNACIGLGVPAKARRRALLTPGLARRDMECLPRRRICPAGGNLPGRPGDLDWGEASPGRYAQPRRRPGEPSLPEAGDELGSPLFQRGQLSPEPLQIAADACQFCPCLPFPQAPVAEPGLGKTLDLPPKEPQP
jgi:hypothetical protein